MMCGDATRREDVMRLVDGESVDLVLTDPPYGMCIQQKDGAIGDSACLHEIIDPKRNPSRKKFAARPYPQIIGDNSTEAARKHYEIIREVCKRQII